MEKLLGSWVIWRGRDHNFHDEYEVRVNEWTDSSLAPRQVEPHVEFNETYIRLEWSDGHIKYFPLVSLASFEWQPNPSP